MKSIDNFEIIKPLLDFKSDDDYYNLQIIQRKKDKRIKGTGNNSRSVKNYYIKSLDQLEYLKEEIIKLSDIFSARASINLNRKSFKLTAINNLKLVADNIANENYNKVYKNYATSAGRARSKEKRWIIDIDKKEVKYKNEIVEIIKNVRPLGDKIIAEIPSKTGVHLITKPFDVNQFKQNLKIFETENDTFVNIEIHKNNPTNLYIPIKNNK